VQAISRGTNTPVRQRFRPARLLRCQGDPPITRSLDPAPAHESRQQNAPNLLICAASSPSTRSATFPRKTHAQKFRPHKSGMTTDRQMAMMYAAQQDVIVALRVTGDTDLAVRLERCMTARRERHGGDGWPRTCRSAGCAWCRLPTMRRWWDGIRNWLPGSASSLAIIPVQSTAGLCDGVRRLRRGLRDVRDRTARCRTQWRDVCFAGMAGGDGTALVLISRGAEGESNRCVSPSCRNAIPLGDNGNSCDMHAMIGRGSPFRSGHGVRHRPVSLDKYLHSIGG